MAERGPLDDVNTVIASLYERLSGDLPGQGSKSDREILASLAADPGVLEALSFPREALRQNKNLTLAKQLLAQGKYRKSPFFKVTILHCVSDSLKVSVNAFIKNVTDNTG